MKVKSVIIISIFMLILSVGAISAADTDNMNVTDVSYANDASLAVESTPSESVNADGTTALQMLKTLRQN